MRDRTRGEPGNLAYVAHEDADAAGVFVLYEQYVDRAGFDAHTRTSHFEEQIIAVVRPLLEDRSVVFANVLREVRRRPSTRRRLVQRALPRADDARTTPS